MNLTFHNLVLDAGAAIDLHLHTTYSDGQWTPENLLDFLVTEQFSLGAITDHDRPDTALTLQQQAQARNQPILVGAEMSTVWHDENTDQRLDHLSGLPEMTDLLCYGFDPGGETLRRIAQDLLQRQQENTQQVYENLLGQGFRLPSAAEALAPILDQPALLQPHKLAAVLLDHEIGKEQPSAGRILLEAGCMYALNDLAAVVAAVHEDGGVCVLAHPGHQEGGFVTYDTHMLDKLRQEIPIDGLEVYHPQHTSAQVEMYLEYAQQHHLLISAGSDSHQPGKPPIKYRAEICRDLLERVGIQVV